MKSQKSPLIKIAIIVSIAISGASAHLSRHSVFAADSPADIEIVETSLDGSGEIIPWHDITDAMPGQTYDLSPSVVNLGTDPAEVSICITQSGKNPSGESVAIPDNTFEISINSDWIKNPGTNCYKYNLVLDAGSTTSSLFDRVTISSTIGNEYQNTTFNLTLTATSISGEPDIPEPINPSPSTPDTGFVSFISSALPSISIFAVIISFAIIIIISITHKKSAN